MEIAAMLYCQRLIERSHNPGLGYELLAAQDFECSAWEDRESGESHFVVYALTPEAAHAAGDTIRQHLESWRELGLDFSEPEYFTIRKEEWSEVWKRYFNIIHIADNLVIRPSWLPYRATPGQAVVDIDPGMSFGTGQHATTGFCLRVLADHACEAGLTRVLDAGCGSGILAIAAAKLGYAEIDAFDFDSDAVRISRENLERNGIAPTAVRVFEGDATRYAPARQYDLALVNILGHILRANAARIAGWVRPGGYLALAGILAQEYAAVRGPFLSFGAVELAQCTEKEWTSGLFRL